MPEPEYFMHDPNYVPPVQRKVVWAVLIRDFTCGDPSERGQGALWAMHYQTEDQALADVKTFVEERRKGAAELYEEDTASEWEGDNPREPDCCWRVTDGDGETIFEFEIRPLTEAT